MGWLLRLCRDRRRVESKAAMMRRRPKVSPLRGDLPAPPPGEGAAADESIGAFGVMRMIDQFLGPPANFTLWLILSLLAGVRRRRRWWQTERLA